MMSRRALFGLSAGAAVSAVAPASADASRVVVVGLDFGTKPAAHFYGRTLKWQCNNPEIMAEYQRRGYALK